MKNSKIKEKQKGLEKRYPSSSIFKKKESPTSASPAPMFLQSNAVEKTGFWVLFQQLGKVLHLVACKMEVTVGYLLQLQGGSAKVYQDAIHCIGTGDTNMLYQLGALGQGENQQMDNAITIQYGDC